MKIPLEWLREYVDIDISTTELVERMSIAGLEVESVRLIGLPIPEGLNVKVEESGPVWDRDKIVIAEVTKVDKHPDADKLKLPTVAYGEGRTKDLVTGAPNINVGDSGVKVVLALQGSVLFDGHSTPKKLKALKPSKIRGIPSDAMVCSEFELGMSEEHEGIILLEDDAPVGMPLADFMGDIVLDVDVLPNMGRCLAMLGVAREVAALTEKKLKLPPHSMKAEGDAIEGKVSVLIEDPHLSPRYACALLEDITVGKSPGWMQRRLGAAGMRPINNIVDITNFVMLEWGQPLHAFDYDILKQRAKGKAPKIIVRPAREGETLKTLDDIERKLTPDMLLIADEAGPIALAGVMGGAETEVGEGTKNVLLESANFDFVSIRRTMRALNLPSEASLRFSRGVHPELVQPAAERAADLMRESGGATVCKGLVDCYPAPLEEQSIVLPMSEVKRILGIEIPIDECARLLETLEFQVVKGDAVLHVTTPSHRRDIQEGAADLIEDLARLHGYDRLPATLLADQLPAQATNESLEFEERLRDLMAYLGLQEAITYALTTPEREALLGNPPEEYVRLVNPATAERTVMRQSVLSSLLEVTGTNLKHTPNVRLFEVGTNFVPVEGERLPNEGRRLAVVMTGQRDVESWIDAGKKSESLDFFDLKGIVEEMVSSLHLTDARYEPSDSPTLHPARAAKLILGKTSAGSFGQLHPKVAADLKLTGTLYVGEFDVAVLLDAVPERHRYRPISRFEAALRDVAVVVEDNVSSEKVTSEIVAAGGKLLSEVRLFDVYRGKGIPEGSKSLAFALSYQSDEKTLTDKEVDKAHKKIEGRLKHVLNANIRGRDE